MDNELLRQAYKLQQEKAKVKTELDAKKIELDNLENQYDEVRAKLLEEMKAENIPQYDMENLHVLYSKKETVGYMDENTVITYLKNNGYGNCISIKESISKKELNKALKASTELKETLNAYLSTNVTEYVTVMDDEALAKMNEAMAK